MKDEIKDIINNYLKIFNEEQDRQKQLSCFLDKYNDEEIIDWNNFDGHIVASGFIYAKEDKKFLLMFHNDMNMFVYPGGHVDKNDKSVLEAAIREVKEETNLLNFNQISISNNRLIPIDIDTHIVNYNERLNLREHIHFDFRYLFYIDKIVDIEIDGDELSSFKWIDIDDLNNDPNYSNILNKINKLLN